MEYFKINDITSNQQEITGIVTFNHTSQIFRDHFPGNPIVPGVLILKILKDLYKIWNTSHSQTFSNLKKVKFIHPINPKTICIIQLNKKMDFLFKEKSSNFVYCQGKV